ncbi:hypothetical protein MKW94_016640, partial [Papaver nudicaule]|nr:hypothetical protein [Papaver nudicaule]
MTKFAGKYAFHLRVRVHPFHVLRINKMLSVGAFGKPFGTCARVSIGQDLLSVRCKDNTREALRRAKFKFPVWHAWKPLNGSSKMSRDCLLHFQGP